MKSKILLLASALCLAAGLQAQAPQKFNYQGIARSGAGAPLVNQSLGLEITILNGTTAQFVEHHTATTNGIGLYTVQIGGGTAVTGTMSAVTWSAGNKFIKVGIDPNGGTSYTNMGTTELLSVPYALYAGGSMGWGINGNSASATDFIGTTNDQDLRFKVNGVKAGSVSSSGRTAIGYNAVVDPVTFNATAIGAGAKVEQSNAIVLGSIEGVNGATASALVGIGTTAPTAPLEIKSMGYTNVPQLRLREETGEYTRVHFQNSNTGAWVLAGKKGTTASNSLFNVFYSEGEDGNGGSDIMSISGQGKVGINTSSEGDAEYDGALSIKSKTLMGDNLTLVNYDGTLKWSYYVSNASLMLWLNGSSRGVFNATTGAYSSTSDRRLKENILPVNNVLDQIKGIEVMRYSYKADKTHQPQLGYIAQNLEEHFPEFVNKPETESGKESFYTVNYAGMSAVAIKAIQEQQAMIEGQQATIKAQQATIGSVQEALAKVQARLDQLDK